MQINKQELELDMEQWTGSKLGKEYVKTVVVTLLFNLMQSISWEVPGRMSYKLESRLLGEIPTALDMQMIPL